MGLWLALSGRRWSPVPAPMPAGIPAHSVLASARGGERTMRSMRLKRSGPVALAVLMTALVASCQGAGTDTDKAGGAATMTLRLGTADPAGRPGSQQVEEFARQIGQRSGGRMRIEPVWSAAEGGRESQGWDQRV